MTANPVVPKKSLVHHHFLHTTSITPLLGCLKWSVKRGWTIQLSKGVFFQWESKIQGAHSLCTWKLLMMVVDSMAVTAKVIVSCYFCEATSTPYILWNYYTVAVVTHSKGYTISFTLHLWSDSHSLHIYFENYYTVVVVRHSSSR